MRNRMGGSAFKRYSNSDVTVYDENVRMSKIGLKTTLVPAFGELQRIVRITLVRSAISHCVTVGSPVLCGRRDGREGGTTTTVTVVVCPYDFSSVGRLTGFS